MRTSTTSGFRQTFQHFCGIYLTDRKRYATDEEHYIPGFSLQLSSLLQLGGKTTLSLEYRGQCFEIFGLSRYQSPLKGIPFRAKPLPLVYQNTQGA